MADPAEAPVMAPVSAQRQRYWRRNLQLTAGLLLVWFLVSFGVTFFARELSFSFFGWPFSYWVGAQGAILVYLGIVALYAQVMDRLDRAHGAAEDSD
jgi:putative solute:sodium symporter small subunit